VSKWDELIIGISPFDEPNARLVASVTKADGLGVLDLGAGDQRAREALALTGEWTSGRWGVRVTAGCALEPVDVDYLRQRFELVGQAQSFGAPTRGPRGG
jgi:hypothetical protein